MSWTLPLLVGSECSRFGCFRPTLRRAMILLGQALDCFRFERTNPGNGFLWLRKIDCELLLSLRLLYIHLLIY